MLGEACDISQLPDNMRVALQYRLTANYKDANFISTRVSDKVVITALMMLLYWGKGDDLRITNLLNVSTLLYMWAMLPGASGVLCKEAETLALLHEPACSFWDDPHECVLL